MFRATSKSFLRPRDTLETAPGFLVALLIWGQMMTAAAAAEPPLDILSSVGHSSQVEGVAFSTDGTRMISSSQTGPVRMWVSSRLRHVFPGKVAAITADGSVVVTAGSDFATREGDLWVWNAATGELLRRIPTPSPYALAVSPDGSRIVAASGDGSARAWDLSSGALLYELPDRTGWFGDLAISADGTLAATSVKNTVWLWRLDDGALQCTFQGHSGMVADIEIAGDATYVATASHDGSARIWDVATCKTRHVLKGGSSRLNRVVSSGDGRLVLTAGSEEGHLWDVVTGESLYTRAAAGDSVTAVAFDHFGKWAAFGHLRGTVKFVDLETLSVVRTLKASFALSSLALSPDGSELAMACGGGIFLAQLISNRSPQTLTNRRQEVSQLVINHDGSQLVSESPQGIKIWDLSSDRPPTTLGGSRALASRDGSIVAIGAQGRSQKIRLWQREDRMIRHEVKHEARITSFDLSASGDTLLTGAGDGSLRRWNTDTGELEQEVAGPASSVSHVALAQDGSSVVATYGDGSLWIWDLGSSAPRRVLNHPEPFGTQTLLPVPGTDLALTVVTNGGTTLWDLAQGGIRQRLNESFTPIDASAFTADGRLAIAGNMRPGVWSLETGRLLFPLVGHRGEVEAISSFGSKLLTGAQDGALGLWDAEDGRLIQLRPERRSGLTAVAASPLGDFLISGDRDGNVHLQDSETGVEIVRLLSSPTGGWAVVAPDGRWDAPAGGRDPMIVAWSGNVWGLLADHPERRVPGLLGELMRERVARNRRANPQPPPPLRRAPAPESQTVELPRTTTLASEPLAPSPPDPMPANPRHLLPTLEDLEPSAQPPSRLVAVALLPRLQSLAALHVEGDLAYALTKAGYDAKLHITDLSEVSKPKHLATLYLTGYPNDLGFSRDHLYLTDAQGLMILDVSEPTAPQQLESLEMNLQFGSLDITDRHAVVGAGCKGLFLFDLGQPERPVLRSSGFSKALGCPRDVVTRGNTAYVTVGTSDDSEHDNLFAIFDITQLTAPRLISKLTLTTRSGSAEAVRQFAVAGDHAYLATGDGGLQIVDVSDPVRPKKVAHVDTPALYGLAIQGDLLVLYDAVLGLQLLDIGEPGAPRFGGALKRFGGARYGSGVLTAWGEHLLFSSPEGVQIVRLELSAPRSSR